MAAHRVSGESMRQDNLIPKMFSSVSNTLIELEVLGINYHWEWCMRRLEDEDRERDVLSAIGRLQRWVLVTYPPKKMQTPTVSPRVPSNAACVSVSGRLLALRSRSDVVGVSALCLTRSALPTASCESTPALKRLAPVLHVRHIVQAASHHTGAHVSDCFAFRAWGASLRQRLGDFLSLELQNSEKLSVKLSPV